MADLDIIPIPGYPGKWARRVVVEAWITAGRPYVNWAGRTYEEQKHLYNLWLQGRGNAADNPDANTRQPHVRGMALDLAGYSKARMEAAGFTQPIWRRNGFSQDEPWHWELARYVGNVRAIPKVTAGQVAAVGGGTVTVNRPVEDIQRLVGATPDGIYGPGTVAKVKAWQEAHGLFPDGVWGPSSDALGFPTNTPETPAEDEEDDMPLHTVHARADKLNGTHDGDWTLSDPTAGLDLKPFTYPYKPAEVRRKVYDDGDGGIINEYRGFYATNIQSVFLAWARTWAKGGSQIHSVTPRDDYQQIQIELSRVAAKS